MPMTMMTAEHIANEPEMGMTLRDYFAAKALQGFLASTQNGDCDMNTVAKSSFLFADAMLKARET